VLPPARPTATVTERATGGLGVDRLTTPQDRFSDLEGFDVSWTALAVTDPTSDAPLSMAVVDTGASTSGETVVLLHGEPTWSYLYRKVLVPLVAAGHRVVVPDLIGFGRSDKPTSRTEHTYARHVEWLREALFDVLELRDVTLFGQDWGGLLGLRLVGEHAERFRRVAVANTGLPTGDAAPSEAFLSWQEFSQSAPTLPIGTIVQFGCVQPVDDAVVAAYDAPFPDETYKEGPRQMPTLVPTSPDDPASAANRAAWDVLGAFERPFLCCFSDGDPITSGADRRFVSTVPGAASRSHVTIQGAGHFVQEDRGEELGRVLVAFINEG
jgi:haloalkane dehalogenase